MKIIKNLTDCDTANLGLLVMYAWDMCDLQPVPTSSDLDPRIAADGWRVVGIITGADDIAKSGPSIRQQFLSAGDRRRYGYLAVNNADPNDYVAVIRGTDGAEEWMDDFDFVSTTRPAFAGRVETGFADIYESMQIFPVGDFTKAQPLADGITQMVGATAGVTVLGHSLGSSLATLLTYELALPTRLGKARTAAVLFASPMTGDHDFVNAFAGLVDNYRVINYQHDVVPDVPPFDIFHLDLYRTLPQCRILMDGSSGAKIDTSSKGCCHHLLSYVALLCPAAFNRSKPDWNADNANCAKCVTV